MPKKTIKTLQFSSVFIDSLTPDPLTPSKPSIRENSSTIPSKSDTPSSLIKTSRIIRNAHFTFLKPELCVNPKFLLGISKDTMQNILEFDVEESKTMAFEEIFSGNYDLQKENGIKKFNITLARPYAVAYGGHQFGFYGGQLGDGRCISLGQVIAKNQNLIELSIKGTEKTPYSRLGDGFCTVSSSVREFLAAEFMAKLGVRK